MSQENVEVVRRLYEASEAEGGFDALLRIAPDELVWISDPRFPGGGTYRGKEAVRNYFAELSVFEGWKIVIDDIIDVGDRVLGMTTIRAAAPPTGPPGQAGGRTQQQAVQSETRGHRAGSVPRV